MANTFFQFKSFRVEQDACAMKVSTDACLFGAWVAARSMVDNFPINQILDIGTGTGLLSLMLAQMHTGKPITAIEIDEPAAKQAAENIQLSPWPDQLRVLQTDIRDFTANQPFDLIISNPPFYETDLTSPDPQKNSAHHDASLDFETLTASIDRLLSANGRFYILLPLKKLTSRIELLRERGLYVYKQVWMHHSPTHPANRIFLAGSKQMKGAETIEKIELIDANGQYTEVVRQLLKDYYLIF